MLPLYSAAMAPTSSAALREALARTQASYDATPYESTPHARLQPTRVAAAALWFGLAAPPASTARVLEIGCASGGHIIPLAARWPKARFVGVDLSPAQIAAGEARIQRLGLANIALGARSLDEIGAADGAFDFIVCHGVLSWIAEPLREALFRVVSERLAPEGVAVVSFNVLPGWRLFQIARDSLILHARLQAEPEARTRRARELLDLLAEESNGRYSYGRFWREEARRLAAGGEAYLAHEIFEDENDPLTFSDFCAALDRHALAYVGECNVAANREDAMAPAGAASIRGLARGDDRVREQYLDIFSGRAFREALITHAVRAGSVRREIPRDRLDAFHFVPASTLSVSPPSAGDSTWKVADGEDGVLVDDEAVASAIGRLIARAPRSSRLEDIAPAAATEPGMRAQVGEALASLVAFGLCSLSTEPVVCAARLAERPVAWRLAASDAGAGDRTANLRHAPVKLEPLQRLFLPLLDGTRTRDDLVAHALDLAERGELTVSGPGGPIEGRPNLLAALEPAVDRCLKSLLGCALLEDE
jgi:predicted O-methyltransferase YrrM